MQARPFRILGLQQIAIGGLDKGALRAAVTEVISAFARAADEAGH